MVVSGSAGAPQVGTTNCVDFTIPDPEVGTPDNSTVMYIEDATVDMRVGINHAGLPYTTPDPVVAGSTQPAAEFTTDNALFFIRVNNDGPADATNVEITVTPTLPSCVTYVGHQAESGTYDNNTGKWTLASFPVSISPEALKIYYDVSSCAVDGDTILMDAMVTAVDQTDTNSGNDTAQQDSVDISRESDMSMRKGDNPDPVIAGGQLTYQLTVANTGPSDADNVTVLDVLPADTTYVSDTSGGLCTPDSPSAGQVTCLLGTITAGAQPTIFDIVVDVASSVAHGTTISNVASVSSDSTDPDEEFDRVQADTTVNRESDLAIRKADDPGPDPVIAGTNLTYTLGVANNGLSDADNVTVVDTLPTGTSFVSTDLAGGCVEAPAGTLTCDLGNMVADPGVYKTFEVVVLVDSMVADGTTLLNSAAVSSDSTDPVPGNDQVRGVETLVETEAYFNVTKTWVDGFGEVPITLTCGSGDVTPAVPAQTVNGQVTMTVNGFDNSGSGTDCTVTEEEPLGYDSTYELDCDVVGVESSVTYDCAITNTRTTTKFLVTKYFTDTNPGTVTVSIACNTGLILQQDFDLADGEVVEFQVKEFNYEPGFWCEIVETNTNGYVGSFVANDGTPSNESCYYFTGDGGNALTNNTCVITNSPDYVDVTVGKEWLTLGSPTTDIDMSIYVDVVSRGMIKGGVPCKNKLDYCKTIYFNGDDPADVVVEVKPVYAGTDVYLTEGGMDQYVESDNDCGSGVAGKVTIKPGVDADCTFTNTVFFEGIPTLNQYGMALLALLMLGMGMVGMRRFV